MRFSIALLVCAACGSAPAHKRATTGAIAGLAHDRASGESIAMAELRVEGPSTRGLMTTSNAEGFYDFDHLAPGRYTLHGLFAAQPVTINNVEVSAGLATYVDIEFTLGNPEPLLVDYGDPRQGEIRHYASTNGQRIDGTVTDSATRERIAGAVVTATSSATDTLQTVTDDQGRYRFADVQPGTYVVSAYYSIGGRGQIEVRRSDITIDPKTAVFVPLWVELAKQ